MNIAQKPTSLFDRALSMAQRHKNNTAGGLHVLDEFLQAAMSVAIPANGADADTAKCVFTNHREDMIYAPQKMADSKKLQSIAFYDLRNGLVLDVRRAEGEQLAISVSEMSVETNRKLKQNYANALTA